MVDATVPVPSFRRFAVGWLRARGICCSCQLVWKCNSCGLRGVKPILPCLLPTPSHRSSRLCAPAAVNRAGRLWAKRRLRTVALFALELGVQTANLVRPENLRAVTWLIAGLRPGGLSASWPVPAPHFTSGPRTATLLGFAGLLPRPQRVRAGPPLLLC